MSAISAVSVTSKHTCDGDTWLWSRHSTTNSRKSSSPRLCAERLMVQLRFSGRRMAPWPRARERGAHDPAVEAAHQVIALGGLHELLRLHQLAVLVGEAQEHFHGRALAGPARRPRGSAAREVEAVLLERGLQLPQPVDLAALPGGDLVARRVDVHLAAAFLLGDVAGRVGGAQQVLDGGAVAADLDEADADADLEHLVLPDEAEVPHRRADVVGDLPRLVERAAEQQHAELVAAEPGHGVGLADLLADQRGDAAQQAVAGDVAAGVVHRLEAVEIQEAAARA